MTIIPVPHLVVILPQTGATFGRPLSSASFSLHDFRVFTMIGQPLCHGKPLSYWIYQVAMPGKKMESGCKAIKEAGADAIPSLVKALQKKDSVLKRIYISIWWKLPALPQRVLPRPVNAVRIREVAAMALGDLGPAGRIAVPVLTQALNDEGFAVRVFAAEALVAINRQTAEHESKAFGGKDDLKPWTHSHLEPHSSIFGGSDAFGNSYSDQVSIGGAASPTAVIVTTVQARTNSPLPRR
jgi:hypothetical protein